MIITGTSKREFFFLPAVRYIEGETYYIVDFIWLKWYVAVAWRKGSEE